MEVAIKRPHLVWRVPQGYVDNYYNPANFKQKVLDKSVDPVAWVPFFTQVCCYYLPALYRYPSILYNNNYTT